MWCMCVYGVVFVWVGAVAVIRGQQPGQMDGAGTELPKTASQSEKDDGAVSDDQAIRGCKYSRALKWSWQGLYSKIFVCGSSATTRPI